MYSRPSLQELAGDASAAYVGNWAMRSAYLLCELLTVRLSKCVMIRSLAVAATERFE